MNVIQHLLMPSEKMTVTQYLDYLKFQSAVQYLKDAKWQDSITVVYSDARRCVEEYINSYENR